MLSGGVSRLVLYATCDCLHRTCPLGSGSCPEYTIAPLLAAACRTSTGLWASMQPVKFDLLLLLLPLVCCCCRVVLVVWLAVLAC